MILISGKKKQYKANLHCHSTLSDGELAPEELKRIYRDRGYSVLAITDHEYPFDHSEMSEKDFLMLTGYEAYIRPSAECKYDIYGPEIHINLFAKEPHNISYVNYVPICCKYIKDEEYLASLPKAGSSEPREYTPEYVNSFVKNANDAGYLCAHNHPVWSLERHEDISRYKGFFSMEMCNFNAYLGGRLEYNGALYDRLLREGHRLFCHGSDDNHNHAPFDNPKSDSFGAFTMISAECLEYSEIVKSLENGDFYSSTGPTINELSVVGTRAFIRTEPAKQIIMHFGSKSPRYKIAENGSFITEAKFDIPKEAPYIRFSVFGLDGSFADTRGYFIDELGI